MKNKPKLQYDLDKYEHELSSLEHIRDYVQMKIDIVIQKIKECRHILNKLEMMSDKVDIDLLNLSSKTKNHLKYFNIYTIESDLRAVDMVKDDRFFMFSNKLIKKISDSLENYSRDLEETSICDECGSEYIEHSDWPEKSIKLCNNCFREK